MVKVALLLSISVVLMYVAVPIFPAFDFLKLDFSDLPALIGAFAFGPITGILIEALKNILIMIFKGTQSGGIGELANFLIGASYVGVAGLIYKKFKTKKAAYFSVAAATVVMTAIAVPMNTYVLIPMYKKFLPFINDEWTRNYIYTGVIPFNLIKASLVSIITVLIYKRISVILRAEKLNKEELKKKTA
jgi:riboflavin transporter FmnP